MPKLRRLYIENAYYHIITRGNQKQTIFREGADFEKYKQILKRAKIKYAVSLYAYCLMPNHVHLLIKPSVEKEVSRFMHWINRGFTAYFNAKYDKVGHLWQGRFISKPILNEVYLLNCAEYIEANPLRNGIAKNLTEHRWSSYGERALLHRKILLDSWGQV